MTGLPKIAHLAAAEGPSARIGWKLVSSGSGLLAGLATRQALNVAWRRLGPSGQEPPRDPADRRTGWAPAVTWAVAVGAGVGVARLVGVRLAATTWERATGEPPPGVEAD